MLFFLSKIFVISLFFKFLSLSLSISDSFFSIILLIISSIVLIKEKFDETKKKKFIAFFFLSLSHFLWIEWYIYKKEIARSIILRFFFTFLRTSCFSINRFYLIQKKTIVISLSANLKSFYEKKIKILHFKSPSQITKKKRGKMKREKREV